MVSVRRQATPRRNRTDAQGTYYRPHGHLAGAVHHRPRLTSPRARTAAKSVVRSGTGRQATLTHLRRMLVARQDGILTDPVRQVTMAQGMMRGVVDALARLRS